MHPESSTRRFVAISRFVVANDKTEEVKQAFRERPGLVDDAPGFAGMDVISPHENPDEILLITYWTDEESYRTWHRGHTYKDSHKGIPKGLKLVRGQTKISFYEYVSG